MKMKNIVKILRESELTTCIRKCKRCLGADNRQQQQQRGRAELWTGLL